MRKMPVNTMKEIQSTNSGRATDLPRETRDSATGTVALPIRPRPVSVHALDGHAPHSAEAHQHSRPGRWRSPFVLISLALLLFLAASVPARAQDSVASQIIVSHGKESFNVFSFGAVGNGK